VLHGQLKGRHHVMDVQPRGHENPLRRSAGGDEPVDRRDRRLEARAGADFRVRGGRGTVHRYLDTLDAKRVETGRAFVVDQAAIGFQLDGDIGG